MANIDGTMDLQSINFVTREETNTKDKEYEVKFESYG